MSVTAEIIDSYFEQYGWSYNREPDSNNWTTGFRGDVSSFRIFVKLTDNWIYFTIIPFIIAPKDPERTRRLNWHLLRLNREINMAKLCLDEDNDVVLTVELPGENLDYSEFSDALGALCYYADDAYLEMLNIAQSSGARSHFDPQDDDLDGSEK